MNTINIGVVGFGFMGKAHTLGYQALPLYYRDLPFRVNLAGVCTAHPESARAAKVQNGFGFATCDPDEIFNNPDIDAVSLCTPTGLHFDGCMAALRAGKHILCDKPLAADFAQARRLADAATDAGVVAQTSFQWRCHTGPMRARQLIEQGRVGNILSFRMHMLHAGAVDPNKPMGWRFDPVGGGVLFDLGSHALDMARFLMGDFAAVTAVMQTLYPQRPDRNGNPADVHTDDAVMLMARLRCGAYGTIEATKTATGCEDELRFEIHGDRGAVRFNSRDLGHLWFFDGALADEPLGGLSGWTAIECGSRYEAPGGGFPGGKFSPGFLRGHIHSVYNFVSCIAQNRAASPSFEDGAYIQYVMEKIKESDQKRAWVEL